MLAALGFTPLFTRVERLSASLALTGGASAAGMGAAGTGPTGMGTALGFTPLFSRVERLSVGLTGGASAAGMGAMGTGPRGMGATGMVAAGMGAGGGRRQANSHRPTQAGLAPIRVLWVGLSRGFQFRRFLCGSSQWCPGRQQVISTKGLLLRMV